MPAASPNELRWLVGKVVHCASHAESQEEYASWLRDIALPREIEQSLDPEILREHTHAVAHAALLAACWLYGHGSAEEARVQAEIRHALARVTELPERLEAAGGDNPGRAQSSRDDSPAGVVGSSAAPTPTDPPEEPAANKRGEQHVSAGRDVNAPIINAPGGHVSINDRAGELNRLLHDYLTFLVYVSLGVKRPHVTLNAEQTVGRAMDSLVNYHGRTNTVSGGSGWGHLPELTRTAPTVYESVDAACRAVLGMTFEEARSPFLRADFPDFDIFGDMVLVPGGHDVFTGAQVQTFYLSRVPVTIGQYAEFCRATSYPPIPEWKAMSPPRDQLDHPVTGVTLFDTVMFCYWLESATGFRFRVVTEPEWCFAATRGRRQPFPWGEDYVRGWASTALESPQGTSPVTARRGGATADGVMDLVGNVWELTSSLFDEDPVAPGMTFTFPPIMYALAHQEWWESDRRIPRGAGPWLEAARFVMRGGSWGGGPEWATMDQRIWTSMFNRGGYGGFRVACSAEPVGEGFVPTPSYLSPRLASFADRVQLTNADGSAAMTQKDFSSCGSGSTWQGSIRDQLIEWALGQYEGVDEAPFISSVVSNRAEQASNPTSFPRLRPQGSGLVSPEDSGGLSALLDAAGEPWQRKLAVDARRAVEAALVIAESDQQDVVDSVRLVRGFLLVEGDEAGMALASLGVTGATLAAQDFGNEPATAHRLGRHKASKVVADALKLDDDGYGNLSSVNLLRRLLDDSTSEALRALHGVGLERNAIDEAINDVGLASRMVSQGPGEETIEDVGRALERLQQVEVSQPGVTGAGIPALLTRLADLKCAADCSPGTCSDADQEAIVARRAYFRGSRVGSVRGLAFLIERTFSRYFEREQYVEALELCRQLELIYSERRGSDDVYAVGRARVNAGVVLHRMDRLDDAIEASEAAVRVLRREVRRGSSYSTSRHLSLLALALNNYGDGALQAGDSTRALAASYEAMQLALWEAVAAHPGAETERARTRLETFGDTYRSCCERTGVDYDPALAAWSEAFSLRSSRSEVAREDPVKDISELWSLRQSLPSLRAGRLERMDDEDDPGQCGFCESSDVRVGGQQALICAPCLSLAEEVLVERGRSSKGPHDDEPAVCSFCGACESRWNVVSGHDGAICDCCTASARHLVEIADD